MGFFVVLLDVQCSGYEEQFIDALMYQELLPFKHFSCQIVLVIKVILCKSTLSGCDFARLVRSMLLRFNISHDKLNKSFNVLNIYISLVAKISQFSTGKSGNPSMSSQIKVVNII